jgi:Uma2 family endonuclease
MRAALHVELVSVEHYLASERRSEARHEFLGGGIYEVPANSTEHNLVCGNVMAALREHLKGKPCRVFALGLLLRLRVANQDDFYYPDVMVACDPRDNDRYLVRFPKVLIEVLSPDTQRVDRREKFLSYTRIESLEEYVLVAQDKPEVTIFRRAKGWEPEVLRQKDQSLRLESLGFATVYEGVAV